MRARLRPAQVNVRRAVLERLPNDLVDEFDDTGFLVAFRDFLVFANEQLSGSSSAISSRGPRRHSIFKRFFDLILGSESELDGAMGVELHRTQKRRVERVAHHDLQDVVLEPGGRTEN